MIGNNNKVSFFQFKPFSKKQRQVLNWWTDDSPVKNKDGIIADGSIRSGKTVSMSLSFVIWAMDKFNGQNFSMCGKTVGSFRRNVLIWLKLMLKSRRYIVYERRSENLLIVERGSVKNYFYIFGGRDESSQDLIQGITLAGVFFDEVALMPESFVNQATGRCSVEGSKLWFNCNPSFPEHWFKQNWIGKADEKNLIYLHFTMDDNLSLSENIKQRYQSMYTGVFYERYILGLWVNAEGLIFRYFAEDPEPYLFSEKDLERNEVTGRYKCGFSHLIIGVDFGDNGSKYSWHVTGFKNGYSNLYAVDEGDIEKSSGIDSEKMCREFIRFYKKVIAKWRQPDWIFCDSASNTLINTLRTACYNEGLESSIIRPVVKNPLSERPVLVDLLLSTGRLKINRNCKNLISSLRSLVWDDKKKDIPKDENIGNINDYWDSFCYTFITHSSYIELER